MYYFSPLPGCFSPFPHGTGSLSVTREYLALPDGPGGFQRNFTCSAVLRIHIREDRFSTTGLLPPMAERSSSIRLTYLLITLYDVSYNPSKQAYWFSLFSVRSLLLMKSIFLSIIPDAKMFLFPGYDSFTV